MFWRSLSIVIVSAAALIGAEIPKSAELPLDLAYSRHEATRRQRPVLSPDGRYLAYEIHTPPVKKPESGGEVEGRFLPTGVPSDVVGMQLWITDVRTGNNRPVCRGSVTCWRGSWSPDSRQLAYFSDEGGKIGLWTYDVASAQSRRVGNVEIKAKLWPGDQAAWSPDGKTVYVPLRPPEEKPPAESQATNAAAQSSEQLGKPTVKVWRTKEAAKSAGAEGGDATAPLNAFFMKENNSTLAAVDVTTGEVRVVVPHNADVPPNNLRLSPDGQWLSYVSVYRLTSPTSSNTLEDLVVVPSSGAKPVAIFRDIKLPDADYFGLTYRWTADSKRIVFWKNQDLWISEIPPRGEPRRLGESLGKLGEEPFLLTTDGSAAIVGIEPEGEKTYYFVPPRALAIVPLDGSAPRVIEVSGTPVQRDEFTLLQPTRESFYLIRDVTREAKREVVQVDIATGKTARVWVGQGRLNIVGELPGSDNIVARFEGLTTPGDYFVLDRKFQVVRRLSEAEPRLGTVKVGPMEAFDSLLPGHDGRLQSVRTHIFLPPGGKRGDKLPTIVYFYSGLPFHLYAQDFGGGAPNSIPVQIFASRGYAVLFCDVPLGPEGKGGNPMQEMTDGVLAQVYRAAELGYSDLKRMAIMGQSYGGYSTAGIITETNLFRAAIALSGVYDLAGGYSRMDQTGGSFNFIWSETGQGRMGTHPWADLRRYIENSPYYQADKIHTPLLIIHGEKDSACPVDDAKKMFNALKRLDREAELAIYAGEGHVPGDWALVNAIDATQRMLDFLNRHVGSKAAVSKE